MGGKTYRDANQLKKKKKGERYEWVDKEKREWNKIKHSLVLKSKLGDKYDKWRNNFISFIFSQ